MIVLLGENHDDILYFENVLRNKKTAFPVLGNFPAIKGQIFNQEVILVHDVVTSYLSGIVVNQLINEYKPQCVIMFGRCKGITKSLHNGDIAISQNIIPLDIDQCEYYNVKLGEIPFIKNNFFIQNNLLDLVNKSFENLNTKGCHLCTFLSANKVYTSIDELKSFGENDNFFGTVGEYVLDSDSISPLIACNLSNIPFISIKIIDSKVGEESDVENFINTLAAYSKVGRGITSFIGEIGRRDVAK